MINIATGGNSISDSRQAIEHAANELQEKLGNQPNYIMVQMNAALNAAEIQTHLRYNFPKAQIHGATSCQGTITNGGMFISEHAGLGLFGICDENGSYGVGMSDEAEDYSHAALEALDRALVNADREGELPDLVWITCCPGEEEDVLAALQEQIGVDIPIVGGSAADNDISGNWQMFSQDLLASTGCIVTVFFSSVPMGASFQSAYLPTEIKATVTDVEGRLIRELDGKPAAEMYINWIDSGIKIPDEGSHIILGETTLSPLGRVVSKLGNTNMYTLSHPEKITAEGYLTTFTRLSKGDEVTLMRGTKEMLTNRASRVCSFAKNISRADHGPLTGGIVVFCAGCMLTIPENLSVLRTEISKALEGAPFITAFTFGEQGQVVAGENCHGNLMISAIVWRSE